MDAAAPDSAAVALQPGYRAVALETHEAPSVLRLAVIVKESPEPVGGPFVLLGETSDASIYLGCVIDAAGQPHEWLEIWVQNLEHIVARHPAQEGLFCNALLDRKWSAEAMRWRSLNPHAFIATGWETVHPPPLFLDLALQHARHPRDMATGEQWTLCTDDQALVAAGLPPYSTSLARYLTAPAPDGTDVRYVPVTAEAAENTATVSLKEAVGNLVPFNPAGGLMQVRRFAPLALDEWSDVLSGRPWTGVAHGRKAIRLGSPYSTLQDATALQQGTGHFLLALRGRAGRMLEAYHLKLQTLVTAFEETRTWVRREQLPFLNLNTDSFRVTLPNADSRLPFLWNARTQLARPGSSIALPVQSADARYFASTPQRATSVFRSTIVSVGTCGQATMRVREVACEDSTAIIEGTLITEERVTIAANDLLSLQFAVPAGRVELYARWAETSEGLSAQELRFRSLPQQLSIAVLTTLREAEGVALPHVRFETFPVISTPSDLYALAVIAARVLLVNSDSSLPVVVDDLLSLGKLVAEQHDPALPLKQRIAEIVDADSRWHTALGPHRLVADEMSPEEALSLFPPDLWWETIGILLRLLPGIGPDSFCRDFGDAPALALERVFDGPLEALTDLTLRSRSLIVIDWNHNREIRSIVESFLARTT